ncbi:MAG: hypothetical protein LBL35_00445 [Clostridiales bacterium]|jgi:hypothetical protein|nr:hypothetical protein [Clostridiales bacterium]
MSAIGGAGFPGGPGIDTTTILLLTLLNPGMFSGENSTLLLLLLLGGLR